MPGRYSRVYIGMKAACFPAKQDLNKVLVVLCTILWRYCGDLSCTVDVDPSHPQAFIEEKTLLCNPDKSRQDSSSARQGKTRQVYLPMSEGEREVS